MKKSPGILCALILLMIISFTVSAEENITSLVENIITMSSAEYEKNNIVTVAFDLTNTSSKTTAFNVYVVVYNEDNTMYSVDTEKEFLWADEKKKMLLTVNIPDSKKDTNGRIFVWNDNMQSTTAAVPFTILSDAEKVIDMDIDASVKLNEDMYCNNLTIEKGTFDLNGNRLFVNGDLIIRKGSSANININAGELIVNGNLIHSVGEIIIENGSLTVNKDYRIQEQTEKNGELTYDRSDGELNMTKENDRVFVNGDFYTQSVVSHMNLLVNGIFKLKGDFYQINSTNSKSKNFDAGVKHKVILSGEKPQTIMFESEKSQFNTLVLTKPKETGYVFSREPCWNTLISETIY